MNSATRTAWPRWSLALAATGLISLPGQAWQVATHLVAKAELLSLKQGYDSNVYLQDHEPNLDDVPKAARPFQESFVTSLTPRLGLDWRPSLAFGLTFSYTPEITFYTSEPTEDYVAHRGLANLGGRIGNVTWDMPNCISFVDGNREAPYYGVETVPGVLDGAPAIGGIPVRDRREQFIYRGGIKANIPAGRFFLRPALGAYLRDFQTVQKLNCRGDPDWGYSNYIDRNALDIGLDAGSTLTSQTRVFVGYRFGNETQGRMVGSPYHYDTEFQRPMAGIEGKPLRWLTANFSTGPEFHHTVSNYAPGFDPDYVALWVDGVLTVTASARDSLVLTWKQNTQPAFTSPSVYEDVVCDGLLRHRCDDHWTLGAGFRGYLGNWRDPVKREDWIYTLSGSVAYTLDEHFSADLTYCYDWANSGVPNTPGREFTRHLASLSLKYAF